MILKYIHNAVNTAMNWLLLSSANPNQASLTIKFFLTGLIPYALNGLFYACGFHVACIPVTSDQLAAHVQEFANVVFYALSIVAWIGGAVAFVRKVYNTIRGQHASLPPSVVA